MITKIFNLNLEGREKLRTNIEATLTEVPNTEKIKFPKETLEQLLFEEFTYNGKKYKLPVWSGEFLQKIDLSEVNFDNVSWSALGIYQMTGDTTHITEDEDYNNLKKINRFKEDSLDFSNGKDCSVCYAGTNAKIDFTKSFEAKELEIISIVDCDFSYCDFSCSYISSTDKLKEVNINNCNFSNCKMLKIPTNTEVYMNYSNFENTNLSNMQINGFEVFRNNNFIECNFKNTFIDILLPIEDIIKQRNSYDNDRERFEYLLTAYLESKWDSCRIIGNLDKNKSQEEISDIVNLMMPQSAVKELKRK